MVKKKPREESEGEGTQKKVCIENYPEGEAPEGDVKKGWTDIEVTLQYSAHHVNASVCTPGARSVHVRSQAAASENVKVSPWNNYWGHNSKALTVWLCPCCHISVIEDYGASN